MNFNHRPTTAWTDTLKTQVADVAAAIRSEARRQPVIVVFGLGSYGDAVQITPLLQALKKKFPEASLVLVHHDLLGAKLLETASYLTKYIRIRSGYHHLLRSRLTDEDYDLMVECRYVVKYTLSGGSRLGEEGARFIRDAQEEQKPWLKFVQNFPFDNDLLWREAKSKGWSMYDLLAQTSGFGEEDFESLHIDLPTASGPPVRTTSLPPRYVVVSNSAEWLSLQSSLWTKSLPHARMKEVLCELKKKDIPTVLLGTKNDPGDYAVDYNLRGKTNLLEAADIIKNACAVFGPEGGLVNLAKAVGTRSVVFFGSTPVEFFRFKDNINIEPRVCGGCWWSTESYLRQCPLLADVPPCVNSLDVGQIVRGIEELFCATS